MLPYDEEDAVKRILRHHSVTITPKLVSDLSTLINWVREKERQFDHQQPPLLITVLSQMGIYGGEVLDKVESWADGPGS